MNSVVIIGTGGTIAGSGSLTRYTAGSLDVRDLAAAVPALHGQPIEAMNLARLDSSDMDHATWLALVQCVQTQLARSEVRGVVVTHGTDTLEETAYLLHRVVQADKPVVMTAAMRPASAPSADGPQNLIDAVAVARHAGARGVLAVLGGRVHAGAELRKLHGWRVDAFSAGDAGPVAVVEDGRLRCFRSWPHAALHPAAARLSAGAVSWPVVDIVTSHAGARGATLAALQQAGAQGLVIAGTGNGSVHRALLEAAHAAIAAGVPVVRASRCIAGGVVAGHEGHDGQGDDLPSYGPLTPAQARVELLLDLISRPATA